MNGKKLTSPPAGLRLPQAPFHAYGEGCESGFLAMPEKPISLPPLHVVERGAGGVRLAAILALVLSMINCTGELPLSDLVNNTITLKVLGTYESNDSYSTVTLQKDDIISGTGITNASPALGTGTDIYKYITGTPNAAATNGLEDMPSRIKYYIDIAEIRMARGQGKSSSQSISDYWSQFAISRQLMCSSYDSADGRGLSNCSESAGIDRLNAFFNGGFTYPAVDVPSGSFNHLGIYFRRFATYPAARFRGDGTYNDGANNATTDSTVSENTMTTAFDNRTLYGIDIESFLQNAYGATNAEPLMFPLQRKDLALNIYNDHEPYVLEVRMFIKNAMMIHVIQNTGTVTPPADPTNSAFVYVAPADWNGNHAYQDLTNSLRQGGAIAMTARTYQPAKVGSINMSATAAGSYFAVQPAGTTYTTPVTTIPLAATAGTNTTITNLQPGSYDVYRMCDKTYCSTASTPGTCDNSTAGTDGFPETASLCTGGPYIVTTGTTTNVIVTNCNASCP